MYDGRGVSQVINHVVTVVVAIQRRKPNVRLRTETVKPMTTSWQSRRDTVSVDVFVWTERRRLSVTRRKIITILYADDNARNRLIRSGPTTARIVIITWRPATVRTTTTTIITLSLCLPRDTRWRRDDVIVVVIALRNGCCRRHSWHGLSSRARRPKLRT